LMGAPNISSRSSISPTVSPAVFRTATNILPTPA
jgi:hypothetical protein